MKESTNLSCYSSFSSRKTSLKYNDGKWHHICLRWDGEEAFLYLNIDQIIISGKFSSSKNEIIPGNSNLIRIMAALNDTIF